MDIEEIYCHLSEDMPVFISRFLPDGTLTYVNKKLAEIEDMTVEEMTGRCFFTMMACEDAMKVREKLGKLSPENPYETHEQIHIDKHGRKHWHEWTNRAFFDENGRAVSFQATGFDITDRKIAEISLQEKTETLTERVKELNCLYSLSNLIESPGISMEEIFEGSLPLIASAFKYPDISCVKLEIYGNIYITENYRDTEWKISRHILVSGRRAGTVKICYLEERPYVFEGPFLKEEGDLLKAIVERLHRVTERMKTETSLAKIYDCLLNLTPDYDINVQRITSLCGEELGASCALYNRLEGNMLFSVGQWHTPSDYRSADRPDGHICYDVIKHGKKLPVIIRNLPETSYFLTDRNVSLYGLMTYGGHPVLCGGKCVGSLCVVFTTDMELTERECRILGILSSALGREEERHMADKSLRMSEKKYRNLFELSRDGIVVVDGNGRFLDANRAYCDMVCYSVEELKEMKGFSSITPEKWHVWEDEEIWNNSLMKDGYSGIYEKEYIRKDGTVFPVEIQAFTIFDEEGKPEYLWGIARDITERRKAENDLKSACTKLNALWSVSSMADADLKTISDHILDTITEMTGSEYGFYGFINEDESVMTIHSWSGDAMKDCSMVDKSSQFSICQSGVWAEAVRKREPFILNDYNEEHMAKKGLPQGHVNLTGLLVVPFFSRGRIISVASVANRKIPYCHDDIIQITSFLTSIQGIIDSKLAQDALRKSEERYRTVADFTYDWEYWLGPDGKFLYCSPSCELVTGYSSHEFEKKPELLMSITYPADRSLLDHYSHDASDVHAKIHEQEFRIIRRDGEVRWIGHACRTVLSRNGEYLGIRASNRDITWRKEADKALRESEARYRLILDHSSDLIWNLSATGTFIYVSPSWERLLGYNPSFLTGKSFQSILHTDDLPLYLEYLQNIIASKEIMKSPEYRVKHADSSWQWHIASCTPVLSSDGTFVSIVGISRDITDRKLAEQEKDILQTQFIQAQKMESVGRLAGGVAHDFNNMLGIILGYTELAREQMGVSHPLYHIFRGIEKAAQRSAELTRQLLAFARKQPVSPRIMDINDTLSGMLRMIKRLIGEDILLTWKPGVNLMSVRMDPSQLDQILANLCVNARDAITGVGRVTIETENIIVDKAYSISHPGFIAGEYVILSVSDDGCGIEKEALEHIFEPFFTTKEIGKGTGLGLATVYGIVRQNNGFVDVSSEPGKGSTFRIYLPGIVVLPVEIADKVSGEPAKTGGETVLLVEDELEMLNMGKAMLEKLGYKVLSAGSPQEAVRTAEGYREDIHLLITDVVMPEMNGSELYRKVSSICRNIKCLFMSGYTADIISHHVVLQEGMHFIQKPFSYKELAGKVREVMEAGKL